MSAKHTPGPWVAAPYEGFGPRTTVRQGDEKTGMRIASTFETTSPRNIERNEANARLIAAAPELLEALQALVFADDAFARLAMSEHGDEYDRLFEQIEQAHDTAKKKAVAAIAKATGGAQ